MDKPVYLDWAATAPLCKEAADAMAPYLQAGIDGLVAGNGNANSLYEVGRTAFRALEQAREDIARSIKARPDEVTFTSGATEADNAALFGIVDAAMARAEQEGDHECVPQIVVSSIEHDAVLKAAETLGHWGAQVTSRPMLWRKFLPIGFCSYPLWQSTTRLVALWISPPLPQLRTRWELFFMWMQPRHSARSLFR